MNAIELLGQLRRRWPPPLIRHKPVIKMFLRSLFFQNVPLEQLSARHIQDFLIHHRTVGATGSTLRLDVRGLRFLILWGHQRKRWLPLALDDALWEEAARLPLKPGPFHPYFHRLDALLRYEGLPWSHLLACYLAHLRRQGFGYRQIRFILSNVAEFLEFFLRQNKRQLEGACLRDVEDFFHQAPYDLASERVGNRRTYVHRFLMFALGDRGQAFRPSPRFGPPPRPFGDLGQAFLVFCRDHRGLRNSTLRAHRTLLARLEGFLQNRGIHDLRHVSLPDLDNFFAARTQYLAHSGKKIVLGQMRVFFRFLYFKGHLRINWADRLARPSFFRDHLRPKYLRWDEVQAFLDSIDRSTPLGKRDYAMALLMATLGLRAQEVARLRVRDADVDRRLLFLPERKGGRPDLFPLSPALAQALRDYLCVRPSAPYAKLFLSVRPPIKPLGREVRTTVATRMARHFGRPRSMRVYLLRHSFAKVMLDRGAPLHDIGSVLGHRSLTSTLIYTRVDTEGLRDVSDNYADLLPLPNGSEA